MGLIISPRVRRKLAEKHNVQIHEVYECFSNRTGSYLNDVREEHNTNPPTLWFVAETDYGKKLKIVFVQDGNDFILKTAYPANPNEIRIYDKFSE
jgi:uncharacterized DUF497 family protein